MVKVKTLPWPSVECMLIRPPCCSMTRFQIEACCSRAAMKFGADEKRTYEGLVDSSMSALAICSNGEASPAASRFIGNYCLTVTD